MFRADNNQKKTPLDLYERAIEELRLSREELNETKASYIHKIECLESECHELKEQLQSTLERLTNTEEKVQETNNSLIKCQQELQDAHTELIFFKEIMNNEKSFHQNIIDELQIIKKQISQINPQLQPINSQESVLPILSDLQVQLSELIAELTLISNASGVDYRKLQQLLSEYKWQEADQETYSNILTISQRREEGWLDDGDIKKLPRQDIEIINKLWVKYSEGKFGFSIQKNIWEARKDYKRFAYRVGWLGSLTSTEWIKYDDYTFNLDANKGHLPSTSRLVGLGYRNVNEVAHRIKVFLSRY